SWARSPMGPGPQPNGVEAIFSIHAPNRASSAARLFSEGLPTPHPEHGERTSSSVGAFHPWSGDERFIRKCPVPHSHSRSHSYPSICDIRASPSPSGRRSPERLARAYLLPRSRAGQPPQAVSLFCPQVVRERVNLALAPVRSTEGVPEEVSTLAHQPRAGVI